MKIKPSYLKLWKLLLDKKMNKQGLRNITGISNTTMNRLSHDEFVNMSVLARICEALDCDLFDIVEFVKED